MIERRYYELYVCAGDREDARRLGVLVNRLNALLVDCGYYDDAPPAEKDRQYREARNAVQELGAEASEVLRIRARVILRHEPEARGTQSARAG